MGMFDTIRCDYPLPLPEYQNETFQTKSLDNCLGNYIITDDGRLLENVSRWGEDPVIEEVLDFHGDIIFYTFVNDWRNPVRSDVWVQFRVRFTNGRVQDIVQDFT